MYTTCRQTLYTFCIHARYIFYDKIYTKVCRNVVHILHTNILHTFCIQKFVEMWDTFFIQTFCMHFVYINCDIPKSVHHKHFVYNLHTKSIQNAYINNCMHNGSLISTTYFDPFVVHFPVNHCKQLRLETCWLITGDTYKINGLMDYTLH